MGTSEMVTASRQHWQPVTYRRSPIHIIQFPARLLVTNSASTCKGMSRVLRLWCYLTNQASGADAFRTRTSCEPGCEVRRRRCFQVKWTACGTRWRRCQIIRVTQGTTCGCRVDVRPTRPDRDCPVGRQLSSWRVTVISSGARSKPSDTCAENFSRRSVATHGLLRHSRIAPTTCRC